MDIINIGDKVKFAENQFVVTDIDRLSQPVPYYKLMSLDGDKSKTIWSNGVSLKKIVTPSEVIGNGEQITFDVNEKNQCVGTYEYNSHIYYIKTYEDKVVEFKELA